MKYCYNDSFCLWAILVIFIIASSGCGHQNMNVQDLIHQPIQDIGTFNKSKKYIKAGITVVYLSGSPYEIGLAHGRLCREEILEVNRPLFEFYDNMTEEFERWRAKAEILEKQITFDSYNRPASYGPFVGFNLMQELYGTGEKPNPDSFPAY